MPRTDLASFTHSFAMPKCSDDAKRFVSKQVSNVTRALVDAGREERKYSSQFITDFFIGKMRKSSSSENIVDATKSDIIRIAYHETRNLSGAENSENDSSKSGIACTGRLMKFPIIASLNTSLNEVYTSVKESHSAVETILKRTEDGLTEGAKIVGPVTSKIGESLEEPLKSIDNIICEGLDYLEKNVPSVKLPPGELYGNLEDYVRTVSSSVKKHSSDICTDMRVRLEDLTKVIEGQTVKKTSEDHKNNKSNE